MGPRQNVIREEDVRNELGTILARYESDRLQAEAPIMLYLDMVGLKTSVTQMVVEKDGTVIISGTMLESTLRFCQSVAA